MMDTNYAYGVWCMVHENGGSMETGSTKTQPRYITFMLLLMGRGELRFSLETVTIFNVW
jgi:hypothetical protein